MKNIMLLVPIIACNFCYGQVGINTTAPKSTLHIKSDPANLNLADGLILPTLTRSEIISKDPLYNSTEAGAIIYISEIGAESTTPKTSKISTTGYYYFDGQFWQILAGNDESIYLPSFNLPVEHIANNVTFDLYTNVYLKQYTKANNQTFVSSNQSLTQLPIVYEANELDYIVTYYDPDIITVNSISATGVLNYNVLNTNPSTSSFINILLVIK
ncbi:hypothetical protein K5I29_13140 [Flavobacterium agricola]|uniref:Uncharacterized protein n=1 Tax=Flavobacterium agricola TaxID=2870839 RepID=A0ABY6M119_9FLAO|nr:hypothetical protein [Flavobacterium agricola]UYW01359.1 hypothetical protein K5I29_13140 [Flavobacterium agricola]